MGLHDTVADVLQFKMDSIDDYFPFISLGSNVQSSLGVFYKLDI